MRYSGCWECCFGSKGSDPGRTTSRDMQLRVHLARGATFCGSYRHVLPAQRIHARLCKKGKLASVRCSTFMTTSAARGAPTDSCPAMTPMAEAVRHVHVQSAGP